MNNLTKTFGVYCIKNTVDSKIYVGSTAKSFAQRWSQHRRALPKGKTHMARAWQKYGAKSFEFSILEVCVNKEDCIPREQFYIDTLKPEYNICPKAGSNFGLKLSAEQKATIYTPETKKIRSERAKANWQDPELKERMYSSIVERWQDPEFRAKACAKSKEINNTPERKALQSKLSKQAWANNPNRETGRKSFTDLEKQSHSEAITKAWENPEYKEAHLKVLQSEEHRAKQSESMKKINTSEVREAKRARMKELWVKRKIEGYQQAPITPETRKKLSEAQKNRVRPARAPRLCVCGKPVKEKFSNGVFKGYSKYCQDCWPAKS